MLFRFEHKTSPVISRRLFFRRLGQSSLAGFLLILVSLLVGIAGYHGFENLSFIDSFDNAAMLLSGMGPLEQPTTTGGKIFAGCYALYSGLAVLIIAGVIFGPVIHRFLHLLHADEEAAEKKSRDSSGSTQR